MSSHFTRFELQQNRFPHTNTAMWLPNPGSQHIAGYWLLRRQLPPRHQNEEKKVSKFKYLLITTKENDYEFFFLNFFLNCFLHIIQVKHILCALQCEEKNI